MSKKIGKMIVSEDFYNEVLEETRQELKTLNQDHLVNWSE